MTVMSWRRSLAAVTAVLLAAVLVAPEGDRLTAQDPSSKPRVVTDFDLKIVKKPTTHVCTFIYNGKEELLNCSVQIQAIITNNGITTVRRIWSSWRPGESKVIDLETSRGIEVFQVMIKGGGFVPHGTGNPPSKYEVVYLACRWDCSKKK
jgi:hypothetical protein